MQARWGRRGWCAVVQISSPSHEKHFLGGDIDGSGNTVSTRTNRQGVRIERPPLLLRNSWLCRSTMTRLLWEDAHNLEDHWNFEHNLWQKKTLSERCEFLGAWFVYEEAWLPYWVAYGHMPVNQYVCRRIYIHRNLHSISRERWRRFRTLRWLLYFSHKTSFT